MKFPLPDFVLYLTSNIVTMSGLELVYASYLAWIKFKNGYVGLLVLY